MATLPHLANTRRIWLRPSYCVTYPSKRNQIVLSYKDPKRAALITNMFLAEFLRTTKLQKCPSNLPLLVRFFLRARCLSRRLSNFKKSPDFHWSERCDSEWLGSSQTGNLWVIGGQTQQSYRHREVKIGQFRSRSSAVSIMVARLATALESSIATQN